jgi:hypothetical protein
MIQIAALNDHALAVEAHAPGTITDRFRSIVEAYQTIARRELDALEDLADAVLSGAGEDTLAARHDAALLHSAQGPVSRATVRNDLEARVFPALRREARTMAASAWAVISEKYNGTADKYAAARKKVEGKMDMTKLLQAPKTVQAAYLSLAGLEAELDALASALVACLSLAGERGADTPEGVLSATVDATGVHRRRVREAFESSDRWANVVTTGASLQAPEDLEDFKPARPLAAIETKQDHNGIGVRQYAHDVEDDLLAEELKRLGRNA